MKLPTSRKYYSFLVIGSFLMAVISFSGFLFQYEDLTGRIITGLAWCIVTFGWLSQYLQTRDTDSEKA